MTALIDRRIRRGAATNPAKKLRTTTESMLIRLQQQDLRDEDMAELEALITQWWRAVAGLDVDEKEKQVAARTVVEFRRSFSKLKLCAARQLRYRTQHLLNQLGETPLSKGLIVSKESFMGCYSYLKDK